MVFCNQMEMASRKIPSLYTSTSAAHTKIEALEYVPVQTLRSDRPVWFVQKPHSSAYVIMGRVVACRIECSLLHDVEEEEDCEYDSDVQAPSDDGSSVTISRSSSFCDYLQRSAEWDWADLNAYKPEVINWVWDESESSEDGWYPCSDDSDYESVN